jgi:hypothetical protein
MGWSSKVRFSAGVQTDCVAGKSSNPIGTEGGVKRFGLELTTNVHLVLRSKTVGLWLNSSISLHGVTIKYRDKYTQYTCIIKYVLRWKYKEDLLISASQSGDDE